MILRPPLLKLLLTPGTLVLCMLTSSSYSAQAAVAGPTATVAVPAQPFFEDVSRLRMALKILGEPLSPIDTAHLDRLMAESGGQDAVQAAESILDKYVIANVMISPESRVDVTHGSATRSLTQNGARLFLVKVVNLAGVTAPLRVESPNSGIVYVTSTGDPSPPDKLTFAEVRDRWANIKLISAPPIEQRLSGLPVEYEILSIESRDAGWRTARLSFDVGQGSQDVGFLDDLPLTFKIAPARHILLNVLDEKGQPTMASFIFRDGHGRLFPNPSKRLAPDLYFQPQVYRGDGEFIDLPTGIYTAEYTGGPEYLSRTKTFEVTSNGPNALNFHLVRWIDPEKYGWYSADDHIHPAGCSHYQNPTQGINPYAMDRQVKGEHLNIGAVLVWGPCFYYQRQFFRGRHDNPVSTSDSLLHYDLEVSGFPSSHSGHLVLLNLKQIMYPGTTRIEQWPTWDLPVLQWAKSQGALAGFPHSGWGLAVGTSSLPNYVMPAFDSIGADEYIVDVTYPHTVDFISAGDTPYVWELNVWYQTLNVGFRTRLSGETDFPCVYDGRVGEGRTYARVAGGLSFSHYVKAVQNGAAYVSDGRSHLLNFAVNGLGVGMGNPPSEVDLAAPQKVKVTLDAAAYLPVHPLDSALHDLPYYQKPYWHLERARIGSTRQVPVELVVNGQAVAEKKIVADGSMQKLSFDVPVTKSSWIAVRILPSSHTNPIFVVVAGKPIRASRRSAEWCLRGVNQCWSQEASQISPQERPQAAKAFEHARDVYSRLIAESTDN